MDALNITKSATRREILALFFNNPEMQYYLRQLERILGLSVGNIRRELSSLEKSGMFKSRREGPLRYYSLNKDYPLYEELKNIIFKTVGVVGTLKQTISKVAGVKVAFLYGSYAEDAQTANSDIDLFVVGTTSGRKLHGILTKIKDSIRREINIALFPVEELQGRIADKDHFVTSVLKAPRIFIKGADSDLRKLM